MTPLDEFFLIPEDVFRLGSSASPQLSHVRASDVDIIVLSGIRVVIANRKGISVYDAAAIEAVPLTGWVWKIP